VAFDLGMLIHKNATAVSGGVSGSFVTRELMRRLPDTPPGSDKNIDNNSH